ncbi:MAG: conjugal transfer protein TraF [Planctomycetes bacterium]|nr:conjugal transfer protein TraF [Planctomycetota bacterium]MCW8136659.1 conjugal transfer protein TraF [Planctomycetota bacterium]
MFPRLLFAVCLLALPLCAEEWVEFNTPVMSRGGTGVSLGRGATGAYYNPANAARRPWEPDITELQFDIPAHFSAGLQGQSYRWMFDTVKFANDLFDRFKDGAFESGGGIESDDLIFAMRVIDRLDKLSTFNGDGLYTTAGAGIGARWGNLLLPRDGLSAYVGGFNIAAASPYVDLDSLRGYRLTDEAAAGWEQLIGEAIINSGGSATPSTPAGQQFSADLQAAGYSAASADALAKWAEDGGVNLKGKAGSVLLDFLINTLNGTGQSLESGANPLEGNNSGFVIRGIAWYEIGFSYGFALPIVGISDLLSVGATVRLMQAYVFSELLRIQDMNKNGVEDTLNRLGNKVADAYRLDADAARFNVGFDLGVTITPWDTLAISIAGRNINGPEFRWKPSAAGEPRLIRFDPQFRAGVSYVAFYDAGLPLSFALEMDLNRTASDIMPTYHQQFVRGAIAFEPDFGIFGFGLRVGGFTNIGDTQESFVLTAGLGFRLWVFRLDLGAHMGLETRNFGTSDDYEPVPQRAGVSAQIGLHFSWGGGEPKPDVSPKAPKTKTPAGSKPAPAKAPSK